MSNNLDLSQVTSSQNQKEVTINAQSAELDAALTVAVDIAVDGTNAVTLTAAQFRENNMFHIIDAGSPPSAAITVTVPAVSRGVFAIINETSFEVTVEVSGQGETSPTVPTGTTENASLISCDGVDCRSAGGGGGGAGGGGSTDFNKVSATLAEILDGNTGSYDLTGYFNRGVIHTIKITENHANIPDGGTYDVRFYKKDTKLAADLMYSVDGINPTDDGRIYIDDMVVYYRDDDATDELHVEIDNNDGSGESMSFVIEIDAEVFETGVGGGGGDVVGPGSSVDSNIALFDSTTGKLIKDSGILVSTLNKPVEGFINGGFNLWQRGTSFVGITSGKFLADRFRIDFNGSVVLDMTQQALGDAEIQAITGQLTPFGVRHTITTADVTIANDAFHVYSQFIEGYRALPYMHNQFTISFVIRSSLTGTYCLSIRNSGADQSYLKTFTVDSANTLELKTITVPIQDFTSGTWDYGNGSGLLVGISFAAGTDFHGTDAVWGAGNKLNVLGTTNGLGTVSATFDLTAFQMDLGPTALPFRGVGFGPDLAAAQRYYAKSYAQGVDPGSVSALGQVECRQNGTTHLEYVPFPVTMRATPTVVAHNPTDTNTAEWEDATAAVAEPVTLVNLGMAGFTVDVTAGIDNNELNGHWTADAEI